MKSSLFTLFSIVVIDLIGFGIVIPVLPFYAESYGANATILGLILTSYAGMQFLFAPLWGRVSDRIGRRPVMLMTIAGASVALLILGLSQSLLWLFIARILGGVFGANISVATAYVTDLTTEENRTQWMGMIGASFGIGFVLGPAIGGLLAPYGYHVPMFVAAGMAAINCVYACFVLKEPPRHQETTELRQNRKKFFQNSLVRRFCGINLLFTIAVTQLEAVFAFYMMDRFHYDARDVAWVLVMMALIMVGIQGGGIRRLAKKYGEKQLLITGTFLMAIGFAFAPWSPHVGILLVPLAFSSVGRGIAQPSMLSLVSSAADAQSRGSVMGLFQSSASLGRIIGPSLAGLFYDRFFGLPFWLGAVLLVVVGILAAQSKLHSRHAISLAEAELSLEEV